MGCAGVTVFNALRRSAARPGDVVGIIGIGGLGHLAAQFSVKLGFETVAISRGTEKEPLAKQFGVHHYIDSQSEDVKAELRRLGGAKAVLATAPSSKAITDTIGGLAPRGGVLIVSETIPTHST